MENKDIVLGDISFPPRKVWIKTYGCQMNYHDSERIYGQLSKLNFTKTEEQDDADLLIFNTCSVRDLANQKFYSHLGETKKLKKENKEKKIAVCGCMAQTEGKEMIKKYKQLDFAFGTDVIDSVGEFVYRSYSGEDKFSVNTWDKTSDYSIETQITHGTPQAFVNIIKGCDKFCSYCIVPFTRGREKSRKIKEIVDDVRKLVDYQGIQEITLLGQNVNSFGKENSENLAQLISALDDISGLELIRYTTSHPYDVSDELIAIHGSAKKLSNHLHLPVQSGSNTVLQRMLRQYTVEHYLGLLEKLRKSNPNIVISSDIIAGFPNETEAEHRETLELLEKAQFDFIYSYAFSVRRGTKAARMDDILTKDIRGRRLREIQAHQVSIQEKLRKQMEGKVFRVLVEGSNAMKGVTKWKGRTNCWRIVHFESPENLMWHWLDVKVVEATAFSCQGEIIADYGKNPPSLYQ
ncbi:MAG: tRNA (N6-isopentenyl adenosine(37)-C2)-methylthiotransferase MiaB [Halobacteriovoraceae bacterium]|nr:tRNA (N6-isopentenyl adenosine(37)-C2)-methylthiotransferase MiaB [Halobacteriovoraceae bacterium]MCB9094115.1 tRNA (N6-isopentenyl adenosine(37)-C2)-methylthiotransferase MiaB [Halobacteriovoraceae bacterium]